MSEPIMDNRQRALQVWSLLVLAARTQTVLSYGMVARMTGLPQEHGAVLGYIAYYCIRNKLSLLTSLDVSQETGNPSAEFYKGVDVEAEHRRCFVYNWLDHGVPTLDALDEAWKIQDKLKHEYKERKAGASTE